MNSTMSGGKSNMTSWSLHHCS